MGSSPLCVKLVIWLLKLTPINVPRGFLSRRVSLKIYIIRRSCWFFFCGRMPISPLDEENLDAPWRWRLSFARTRSAWRTRGSSGRSARWSDAPRTGFGCIRCPGGRRNLPVFERCADTPRSFRTTCLTCFSCYVKLGTGFRWDHV